MKPTNCVREPVRPSVPIRSSIGRAALLTLALAASLLSSSCSSKSKAGFGQEFANPVNVAQAESRDVPLQIKAIGSVQAIATVQVKALVGGLLLEAPFKEGQDVKKGDLLFKIDPRPFENALKQAESNLARDTAQLKNAEDEVKRYTGLVQKDYATPERFDQLQADSSALRAQVKMDEAAIDNARLQLEYCTIRSPLDGRTGSLMVYPGNIVKANDVGPLVVINQIMPIYVAFAVPEQNLPLIDKYRTGNPLTTQAFPLGKETPITGVLTFVDNAIDTSTGTIQLKATFRNVDKALWPGEFVNVVLDLAVEKGLTVVPSQAVQTGQTGQYVMVVKKDMTVESRAVEVVRIYEDVSVIRSGLKPGETVVTDGLLRLATGSRVAVKKPV